MIFQIYVEYIFIKLSQRYILQSLITSQSWYQVIYFSCIQEKLVKLNRDWQCKRRKIKTNYITKKLIF